MPASKVQISALISRATKNLLAKRMRATGIKKDHLIEMALLHHLRAAVEIEIPAEIIVPPRIIVSKKSGRALLQA